MLTPAQLRAARALIGIDQRTLAELAGVSLPTIQRMETSDGYVRGVVDTLTKVVAALERHGVELISENSVSLSGGRGVRLRDPTSPSTRGSASRDHTASLPARAPLKI
jgi:transcriptional regulator with XRE-family HTH domain